MQHVQSDHEEQAQSPLTVLVIEDEESIVELIKLGLHYENFEVESAEEGAEGIADDIRCWNRSSAPNMAQRWREKSRHRAQFGPE